jgi:hypothetical protein
MTRRPQDPSGSGPSGGGGDPVVVFRAWTYAEAALVAELLRAAGITCTTVSDVPHSVYPVTVDGLGEIRIVTASRDAERAREMIAASPEDVDSEPDIPGPADMEG